MPKAARNNSASFRDAVEARMAELRIVDLMGTVDSGMAYEAGMRLRYLASENKKPITLYLNTPGGSVVDGLAMYDMIKSINSKVPVNIIANGACMSMGMIILQAGTKRLATPNTHFMLHELMYSGQGKLSEQQDQYEHAKRLQERLNTILSGRTGMRPNELTKKINRKDYYITAEEALKYKLIDEIVEG